MQLTEELREKDEELRNYRLNSQHTMRNPHEPQSSHEDMNKYNKVQQISMHLDTNSSS